MSIQKICGIYKITCIINNKCYVGSSINIRNRWSEHKSKLKKNKHHSIFLQRSWNKYKERNFIFEIVEECEKTKEIILEREQFYIDSLSPSFNILKIAGSPLGTKRSDNEKIYLSIINSGKNHPQYGKTGVNSNSGKKYIIVTLNNEVIIIVSLRIYCIDNLISYKCMGEMANNKTCKRNRTYYRGYKCYHYDEKKYQELLLEYKIKREL